MTDFNPDIAVSVIPSKFSHMLNVAVKNLPPDEIMEYWIFDPDGDILGTGTFNSNGQGLHKDSQGNEFVHFGNYGTQPIKKGIYHFGVNRKVCKQRKSKNVIRYLE